MVPIMVKGIPLLILVERNASTHVLGYHSNSLVLVQTQTEADAAKGKGVYHRSVELVGNTLYIGGANSIKVQNFVEQ